MLEALSLDYPNDPEILQLMGRIYDREGDPTMAAFFLEQACLQQPENIELLYETYQAQLAAEQPGGGTLEKLAALSPETMTKALWIQLGQDRAANNQTEAALKAYLKGVDPDKETPAPATAAAIGQLFVKLDNYPQAENWLEIAADDDAPSAQTALFSLLQIQLSQKDWSAAEATIARLNQQFPGALDASQWQQASNEIKRWRAAQEAMKARLAAEETLKKEAAAAAAKATAAKETAATATESADSQAESTASPAEAGDEGGKSQIVAELAAAEAMANRPAQEARTDDGSQVIAFDPSITITPADPDFGIEVSFDESSAAAATRFSVETDAGADANAGATASETLEVEQIPATVRPLEPPQTLEALLAQAQVAETARDYKSAIRKYWAAISIANNRAEVWNLLSRAYLVDGQLRDAETTALEAVRQAPGEVAYTLDFLRVAQRSRPPEEFLAQLETAYDRFPASPEITLSLARAHERISKDNFVARNLYLRFIDIAPNHPLVPEARQAVNRLR